MFYEFFSNLTQQIFYRILPVVVVYRLDGESDGKYSRQLFGHPNVLYLPSQMTGEFLYESVDRVVPCLANYSILLTDGQVHLETRYI